jgi:hypothetical protein
MIELELLPYPEAPSGPLDRAMYPPPLPKHHIQNSRITSLIQYTR